MGFGMTVVLPADDEETFVRTTDPDSTMSDGLHDGDMLFLAQVIEDQRIANCPYLRWVSGPSEVGADALDDCYDPADILEQLDELDQALASHGSAPPVLTMFYWDKDGRRAGSSLVTGTLDGQECRLSGGWEEPWIYLAPKKRGSPITADRIILESNTQGSPDIEVKRTTLADYNRATIARIRSVCQYAVSIKGLVYCEIWY